MIQWTAATTANYTLTYSSSRSSSSSFSTSSSTQTQQAGTYPYTSSESGSTSGTSTYSSAYFETIGSSTSQSSSSSFSSTFSYASGLTEITASYDTDGNLVSGPSPLTYSDGASGSSSESSQTTSGPNTVTIESSSAQTTSAQISTYQSTQTETTVWSTSSSSFSVQSDTSSVSSSSVVFLTSTVSGVSWQETTTTASRTYFETTALTATTTATATASVLEASAGEVLFAISNPPTIWTGYADATFLAASATRTTVLASGTTEARPSVALSAATSGVTNSETTATIAYTTTETTQSTVTQVVDGFPPISTQTQTTVGVKTVATNESFTVFPSASFTHGPSGSEAIATTTQIERGTSKSLKTLFTGTVSYRVPEATVVYRTKTTTVEAVASSSTSEADGGSAWASGFGENGNFLVWQSQAVLDDASTHSVFKQRYRSTGAVVGILTGGWFTAGGTAPFDAAVLTASGSGAGVSGVVAYDGSGRLGTTLFPQTNSVRTINSNSITWTTTTTRASDTADSRTTQATSYSAQFGVSGPTSATFDQNRLTYGSVTFQAFGGGAFAKGATTVFKPLAGVFKDDIGSTTTSYSGNESSSSMSQSAPVSFWQSIPFLKEPQVDTVRQGICWSAPRNSIGLPPGVQYLEP